MLQLLRDGGPKLLQKHEGEAGSSRSSPVESMRSRPYAPPFSVPLYSNFTLAGLPASTVTSCVLVPYFSCHDSTVYFPGGTSEILKLPSPPLIACRPLLDTPMYPRIHGWKSHFHFITPSSLGAAYSMGAALSLGMPLLNRVAAPR